METHNLNDSMSIKINNTTSRFDYDRAVMLLSSQGQSMYGPGFSIPELDVPVVHKLLAYALHDEVMAEELGIDLHKGIMLTGNIGCGKTSLMSIIKNLLPVSFKPMIRSCRNVSFEFSQKGYETIARYSVHSFDYSGGPQAYCFDDLGVEPNINFWGDKLNVMTEVLLSRYDYFISHKMITHITTNLNGDELENIYGQRLRSRMRSMFNLIAFDPKTADKRK
jgi:energy-coupling factor transporter ATP-binding protein EcfA2